jgi:hypothetical protein
MKMNDLIYSSRAAELIPRHVARKNGKISYVKSVPLGKTANQRGPT